MTKKILICSTTFEAVTHGPARFLQHVYQHWSCRADLDFRIITRDGTHTSDPKIIHLDHGYPRGIGVFWEYLDNIRYAEAVEDLMKRGWVPDVVLFVDALLGVQTKRKFPDTPCIGMVNDYEYADAYNLFPQSSKLGIIRWKSSWLEARACHRLDRILVNSHYLQNRLMAQYRISEKKVNILYKGVAPIGQADAIPRRKISKNHIRILFVKNDFRRGGLPLLIKACKLMPKVEFDLTVIGPHKEDWRKFEHSQEGQLASIRMHYLGKCTPDVVYRQMLEADVFCTPAIREAFGVANLEAMACGCPVIATKEGGIPEVVGEVAFLADTTDPHGLAAAIRNFLNATEAIRESKITRGKQLANETFSVTQMMEKLEEILDAAIDENSSKKKDTKRPRR